MKQLVLSLFPGIGLLDMAFEAEGFCVVRGPDLLWGGDIHRFHPPPEKFDGIIGGPPCPAFSTAANVARAAGKVVAPDLIPEFARIVRDAKPRWWVMENTRQAYPPEEPCYRLEIDNRWVGAEQRRRRCFWSSIDLARHVSVVALEAIDTLPTACTSVWNKQRQRQEGATTRRDFERLRCAQGLPDTFELPGFGTRAACKAVVNGVPLPMGRAVAAAVRKALGSAR